MLRFSTTTPFSVHDSPELLLKAHPLIASPNGSQMYI